MPVDFEAGSSWWEELADAGFDRAQLAVVVSTGVTMYLSQEANEATLRQIAALAPGSTFATTFMLPLDLLDPEERPGFKMAMEGARAAGTPFLGLFSPEEMLALARRAGLRDARHVSPADLNERYFARRSDGLRTSSEQMLVATV